MLNLILQTNNSIKKHILFIAILLVFISISLSVSAASAEFSLKADDGIKAGQPFNIYFSVSCDTDIGFFRTAIYFDSEKLELKSVELIGKNENEYFKYAVSGNKIIIIYLSNEYLKSGESNNTIKIRFSPKKDGSQNYRFGFDVYEVGDKDSKMLDFYEFPELFLSVWDGKEESEIVSGNIYSSVLGEMSKDDSLYSYSGSITSADENPTSSRLQQDNEYSLLKENEDIEFRNDNFLASVGVVVLIAAVAVISFRLGRRK